MNFLLGIILATNTSFAEDLEHLRQYEWNTFVPNVVICNGANIDPQLVERVNDVWRDRGEEVGKVLVKECRSRPLAGEIGIYVSDDMPAGNVHGLTIRNVYKNPDGTFTRDINHSRVYIRPENVDSFILLEHEIGHALGFDDTLDRSSVMSKYGAIY